MSSLLNLTQAAHHAGVTRNRLYRAIAAGRLHAELGGGPGKSTLVSVEALQAYWGSRRYQGKIFGKEESDEITVGRQARLHLKKQDVLLYVTPHADRHVTVLDSKIGSLTPVYRLLEPFDKKAVVANRKFTCRYAWNPHMVEKLRCIT